MNRQLASHGGGVDLVDISNGGVVRLRFTGMCAACLLKPLTMARVVHGALADVDGVTDVTAPGARLSAAATNRLMTAAQRAVPTTQDEGVK